MEGITTADRAGKMISNNKIVVIWLPSLTVILFHDATEFGTL